MKPPLIKLSACVVIVIAITACSMSQQCKIDPPPGVMGTSKEMSAKAAANALGTAIAGGEVGGSYKNAVNNTYQTVGQDDVAFYLLLQAYNCESARGNTAAAAEILRLARQELAAATRRGAAAQAGCGDVQEIDCNGTARSEEVTLEARDLDQACCASRSRLTEACRVTGRIASAIARAGTQDSGNQEGRKKAVHRLESLAVAARPLQHRLTQILDL